MAETHQATRNGVDVFFTTLAELVMVGNIPLSTILSGLQPMLENKINIRSINGQSILGTGDLSLPIEPCKVVEVEESGFFICDKNQNVLLEFTSNGFDVAWLSQSIIDKLKNI